MDHGLACVEVDHVQLILLFIISGTQLMYQGKIQSKALKTLILELSAVNVTYRLLYTTVTVAVLCGERAIKRPDFVQISLGVE